MSRQGRLGILVITAVTLFIAMLFLVARRTAIFGESFPISAEFGYVGGLKKGSPVTYRGIDVGSVEAVALPVSPGDPIRVQMLIKDQARALLRADSRARILSDGVLGNQIVVLTAGTDEAPPILDGAHLLGEDPVEVFDLVGSAAHSAATADSVLHSLNRLLMNLENGQGALGRLLTDPTAYEASLRLAASTERTLDEARTRIEELSAGAARTLAAVDQLVDTLATSDGSAARLLHDPALFDQMLAIVESTDRLIERLDALAADAEIAADWGILTLHRASETLAALRRHRLLRRYFREDEQAAVDATFEMLEAHRQHLREREAGLRAASESRDAGADTTLIR